MNYHDLAPCVSYYTGVFDATNFLEMIEEEAQKSWPRLEWDKSRTGTGDVTMTTDYRSSLSMPMAPIMTAEDLVEMNDIRLEFIEIFKKIDECIWDYRHMHDLPLAQHEEINLLKYENHGEYRAHWDAGNANDPVRTLSMVAYMNDDYEGGEIEFTNFGVKQKPLTGSVLLFPSAFPYKHIAHPVTDGAKYSLVTWFA